MIQLPHVLLSDSSVLGESASLGQTALLEDTNAARQRNGVAPLAIDEKLSEAAFLKAKDMFTAQYWSHTSPDGKSPWYWFGAAGYNYSYAGENLAKNFTTAEGVTNAWLASPEHKANVLGGQFSQVGFAVVDGTFDHKPATIVVALYGAPAGPTVAGIEDASPKEQAPGGVPLSLVSRLGLAMQSISPMVVGSLLLLLVTAVIALGAHLYRGRLPKPLQNTWYKHHGLLKAGGAMALCFVVLFLYSGGQI